MIDKYIRRSETAWNDESFDLKLLQMLTFTIYLSLAAFVAAHTIMAKPEFDKDLEYCRATLADPMPYMWKPEQEAVDTARYVFKAQAKIRDLRYVSPVLYLVNYREINNIQSALDGMSEI